MSLTSYGAAESGLLRAGPRPARRPRTRIALCASAVVAAVSGGVRPGAPREPAADAVQAAGRHRERVLPEHGGAADPARVDGAQAVWPAAPGTRGAHEAGLWEVSTGVEAVRVCVWLCVWLCSSCHVPLTAAWLRVCVRSRSHAQAASLWLAATLAPSRRTRWRSQKASQPRATRVARTSSWPRQLLQAQCSCSSRTVDAATWLEAAARRCVALPRFAYPVSSNPNRWCRSIMMTLHVALFQSYAALRVMAERLHNGRHAALFG